MRTIFETIDRSIRARREAAVVEGLIKHYGYFPSTGIWKSELRNHLQEADRFETETGWQGGEDRYVPVAAQQGLVLREICRQIGETRKVPVSTVMDFVKNKHLNILEASDTILYARDMGWYELNKDTMVIGPRTSL